MKDLEKNVSKSRTKFKQRCFNLYTFNTRHGCTSIIKLVIYFSCYAYIKLDIILTDSMYVTCRSSFTCTIFCKSCLSIFSLLKNEYWKTFISFQFFHYHVVFVKYSCFHQNCSKSRELLLASTIHLILVYIHLFYFGWLMSRKQPGQHIPCLTSRQSRCISTNFVVYLIGKGKDGIPANLCKNLLNQVFLPGMLNEVGQLVLFSVH